MVQEYCGASARRGKVYGCWEYKGCEPSVFRCLQQWLHEQKIPQDGSILEAGYRGTSFRGAENQDQNQNQQLTHSRKIAITEPLPCQLAVDLYFTAWDLDMPQLMDDALTVLYDHYAKVKHPPSPGMVRRVFSNGNYPVGQHLHFLFADLYLKFGVLDHGQSAWANNDVEIWLWDFLQFFLGRCRMLDLQQRIPSPTRVHTAQDGGLRKANGEVAQRSGLAGRLCDYHHHAGCFGGRQPRRGRCEYLKLKRVE